MQVDPAEVSPATGSVKQGECSDPLGVHEMQRASSNQLVYAS